MRNNLKTISHLIRSHTDQRGHRVTNFGHGLIKVGDTTSGLENFQGQSVGLDRSSTTDSGDQSEIKEKTRSRNGRVISTTDLIVNPHLKNIKLETDWVEPVVKIEQGSVDYFAEDGKG